MPALIQPTRTFLLLLKVISAKCGSFKPSFHTIAYDHRNAGITDA